MLSHWKVVKIRPGKWFRANDPEKEVVTPRIHILPVSIYALRFVIADTQPGRDHLTFTGLNPSYVVYKGVLVRAYRGGHGDIIAGDWARYMVSELDKQVALAARLYASPKPVLINGSP